MFSFLELKMSFEELLIDLVREREFLYNTRSKTYKNVLKRNAAWEEIGQILNRPGNYILEVIKSLNNNLRLFLQLASASSGGRAFGTDSFGKSARWNNRPGVELQ